MQPSELLERFGFFEGRLRQSGDFPERLDTERVHPYMGEIICRGRPLLMVVPPEIWYDRAAEHQCVVAGVHHHFRLVGVLKLCVCAILGEGECQSGNVGGVVGEAVHYLPDLPRVDKRLVALYVDDHICVARQVVISLKTAVCSAAMFGGGHDCFCAESCDGIKDSDVVSGHCEVIKH